MKTPLCLRQISALLALGMSSSCFTAKATDYTWIATVNSTWSNTSAWASSAPGTVPGAGDNILGYSTGTANAGNTRFTGGTYAANQIINTGTTNWTLEGSGAIASVLNVGTITGASATFQFRNGAGGLSVNATNVNLGTLNLYFGGGANAFANQLSALQVSGTTTVTGGALNVNVSNTNSNSYALGLLNTSAGTVNLNATPEGKGLTTANVTGLSGSGGIIQNGISTMTGGTTANSSHLIITNAANYSSSAVIRNGTSASGTTNGTLQLTKAGSGTQTLSGANGYSGGTTITAGTLLITSTNGVGTGAVSISEGVLHVNALSGSGAISNAVTITDGDGGYVLERASGMAFSAYTASSDIAGGQDTTASILAGTASTARTLTTGFDSVASQTPTNDGLRDSDVFSLNGTGSDLFVLQLEIADLNATQYLGWLNGTDTWVNAVSGNTGNNASAPQQGYLGSFANFQVAFGTDLSTYVGAYGVDDSGDRVWAVLNHNSDFAVIPEPSTWLLLGAGLGILLFRRRAIR